METLGLTPLSRGRLETFRACQRRFQLRYLEKLPWPTPPLADPLSKAAERGKAFHQLLAQHFQGFEPASGDDEQLGEWWRTFQRLGPRLPEGDRLAELTLTVPIGELQLTGRFDLVIRTPDHLYLYDWKTERQPRSTHLLKEDWQTKLYLLLAVIGSPALGGKSYRPEQVSLTYWFVQAPEQPITFRYSQNEYLDHYKELGQLVGQLETLHNEQLDIWPLTENLNYCQQCAYHIYCGRTNLPDPGNVAESPDWWLEPIDADGSTAIEPEWD